MGFYSRKNKRSRCDDTPISTPTATTHSSIFASWAVPCSVCGKYRRVATEEEYERSKDRDDPFTCTKKPNTSCNDPPDVDFDEEDVNWMFDPPNIPKTPGGFKRVCVPISAGAPTDGMTIYYIAPSGRRLRTMNEVEAFLASDSEFNDLSVDNFSFSPPISRPLEDDDDSDDDDSDDDDDDDDDDDYEEEEEDGEEE